MKLLEYKGKELFKKYKITVPNGKLVSSEKDLSGLQYPFVIKGQQKSIACMYGKV